MNTTFLIIGLLFLLLSWFLKGRQLVFNTLPKQEVVARQIKKQIDFYAQLIYWLGWLTIIFSLLVHWFPYLMYWWPLGIALFYVGYYFYHSKKT